MKIRIEFNCDYAAFGAYRLDEIKYILRQATIKLMDLDIRGDESTLLDSNGNSIGKVILEK